MLREAIDRILALSEPHIVEINGERYADRQMTRVPRELRAEPLEVHTLSALVDYITSGCDDNSDQTDINRRFVVHVEDYNRVRLTRELDGDRRRETVLEAMDKTETFPFGRWLSVEEFIIGMQAFFVPDDTVRDLVKLVSSVTDSKSVQQSDDGMSQSVTAKTGIVTSNKVTVPNPVVLRPLSTFSEIVQPQRSFIFRLRGGESGVCAALYAADGNAWKHRAIDSISLYLKNHIPVDLAEDVIVLA